MKAARETFPRNKESAEGARLAVMTAGNSQAKGLLPDGSLEKNSSPRCRFLSS